MAKQQHGREISRIGKVLLTGHTGFKGVWATLMLEALGIEVVGLSLPAESESLYDRLGRFGAIEEHLFDIADRARVAEVVRNSGAKTIIHMAAQPLVLLSYKNPVKTFETNVMGTANILDAAFSSPSVEAIIAVTTDKVYENKNSGKRFIESDSLSGKDPYSASKVGTESVVAAWSQISKIKGGPTVISARAGNVIGGGDYAADRIIPDIVRGFLNDTTVEIRNPKSTRPWQHALDPVSGYVMSAIDALTHKEQFAINFGPENQSLEVEIVVELAKEVFESRLKVSYPISNQSNLESHFLDLDSTFANTRLGWKPVLSQEEAIKSTFEWWKMYDLDQKSITELCAADVRKFTTGHKFVGN